MEKTFLTLVESGSKSGTILLYIVIGVAVVVLAGYFLLRKKKK
ncbi:MAG: LPXTG cell wall anchor domain-containing protein [Bacteroidia bacterium]|jgi:LPXTG-motif cell wall-anchored protein|nr:LPXTG cell wall anchor domain-containing protein [Bacteroidia bacterium]